MTTKSPFTLNRFENERKHLYYLQAELLTRVEQPKPVYLIGSRGTGKTTLLKSLDWRERLENESLKAQIQNDLSFSEYVGIYLKLPEFRFNALRQWLQGQPESLHAFIFSIYLDLVWLQGLVEALSELLATEIFSSSADAEHKCVRAIFEEYSPFFSSISRTDPGTLRGLARLLKMARESIETHAMLMAAPDTLIEKFQLGGQVGNFGRLIALRLSNLIEGAVKRRKSEEFYFKICMDEGECLDSFQRLVLNTIVRLAGNPVFFVISFVGTPPDLTSTLEHGLTLQHADRDLVLLDDMKDSEFRELADGVATVRVQGQLNNHHLAFNSRLILGELDVNTLLLELLAPSVSPKAKQIVADARAFSSRPFVPKIGTRRAKGRPQKTSEADVSPRLPIYEAYLAKRLGLTPALPDSPKWERRRQDSAEVRKRIVAAYLSICSDVNMEPHYASADMVLQMSDMCIRDFLHQIDCIFRKSKRAVRRFLEEKIPDRVQSQGLREASRDKLRSIPNSGINSPAQTGRVIQGLARLTARLQSTSESNRHLRSSERGIFWLLVAGSPQTAIDMASIIKESSEAGFLRIVKESEQMLAFRVHKSLAPAYGFSYRGAYYPVKLEWNDIARLTKARDETDVDKISDEIGVRVEGASGESLSLFDSNDDVTDIKLQ